jgi:hypothetical protein
MPATKEMEGKDPANRQPGSLFSRPWSGTVLIALFWTLCIALSLAWNVRDKRARTQGLTLVEAKATLMKDLLSRR